MPRGGKRQGTPGKAYSNRTDMTSNYNQQGDPMQTPAAGGQRAPELPQIPIYPEDIPNLLDPTQRPGEPLTDGLSMGPGRGPETISPVQQRQAETQRLKKWLPILDPIADQPDTPDSFRTFVRFIRGA